MKSQRIRVFDDARNLLGEITFTADLVFGQPLQVCFRPADYEPLFRAYIAVMRAARMDDDDADKAASRTKADGILRRAKRTVQRQLDAARPQLWGYNIVLDDTDVFATAEAEAVANYETHTHAKKKKK